jgi:hypothetical protein
MPDHLPFSILAFWNCPLTIQLIFFAVRLDLFDDCRIKFSHFSGVLRVGLRAAANRGALNAGQAR